MIFIGMIFDKGDNKVVIPYYLYRYTTPWNKAGFFLSTPYDTAYGVEVETTAEKFYLALPGAYTEWFETV